MSDLFSFLEKLNARKIKAYDDLTEEEKKTMHPYVIMRWLSGTNNPMQIIRLNVFANKYMFSLGENKSLLFALLAASCSGDVKRVSWLKAPGQSNTKLAAKVLQDRFKISSREVESYRTLLEGSDILQYAEDLGWDKDMMKRLEQELGKESNGSRSTSKGGGRSAKRS